MDLRERLVDLHARRISITRSYHEMRGEFDMRKKVDKAAP